MSMISMLIDRLRSPADLYDGKTQPPMERELQRPHLAQELHDDLQRANTENAKLRELVTDILSYVYDGGFNCSEGTWSCPYFQECFNCPIEEGPERYVRRGCRWLVRGRKLGIEVKGCTTR